jgi:hypothetical protein
LEHNETYNKTMRIFSWRAWVIATAAVFPSWCFTVYLRYLSLWQSSHPGIFSCLITVFITVAVFPTWCCIIYLFITAAVFPSWYFIIYLFITAAVFPSWLFLLFINGIYHCGSLPILVFLLFNYGIYDCGSLPILVFYCLFNYHCSSLPILVFYYLFIYHCGSLPILVIFIVYLRYLSLWQSSHPGILFFLILFITVAVFPSWYLFTGIYLPVYNFIQQKGLLGGGSVNSTSWRH